MAPPAVVDVDEMDVDDATPRDEEEFSTPRTSGEQAPSPDPPVTTTSDSDAPSKSGDNNTPHISGGDAMPLSSNIDMSKEPTTVDTTVTSVVANASAVDAAQEALLQDNGVTTAGIPTVPSKLGSPGHSTKPALGFPSSSALAASLPHNQSRKQDQPTESHVASSSSPATAAPSNQNQSIKEDKELARLKEAIEGVPAEILHKFLRKEWRSMLFSPFDEDHVSYILRACMKNSTPTVVERGLRDVLNLAQHRSAIGQKVLKHVTYEELLHQVPEKVLDQAIAQRLRAVPAKSVIKWLADAGRLGFREDDLIDVENEQVLPILVGGNGHANSDATMVDALPDEPQHPAPHIPNDSRVASGYKDPLLLEQERQARIQQQNILIKRQQQELERHNRGNPTPRPSAPTRPAPLDSTGSRPSPATPISVPRDLKCHQCGFQCATTSGYLFHAKDKVCQKQPAGPTWQWGCENCGKKFGTKQGQSYHLLHEVCNGKSRASEDMADGTPEEYDAAIRAQLGQQPMHDPLPPTRPNFSTAPRAPVGYPPTQPPARASAQIQMPRPPMHTPTPATPQIGRPRGSGKNQNISALQNVDPTARVSPSQLSAVKKAEMDRRIDEADRQYQKALAEIDPQLPIEDQEKRKISLKNGNASKKSQIRKSFGVTLRMRDKDKIASRAAAIATAPPPGPPGSRPPYGSPHIPTHVSPPSSSFSPINAPAPAPRTSTNYPPPQGGLGGRPRLSDQSSQPSQDINNPNDPSMTGFGVLMVNAPGKHRAKRQRTSSGSSTPATPPVSNWIPPSSRTQTPYGPLPGGSGLSTMDASRKLPKKVPVGAAQARWEALQPKKNGESSTDGKREASMADAEMMDAPTAERTASNTRQELIEIDSSSDSEVGSMDDGGGLGSDGMADADKPLPSTEDTSSEETGTGESRPSSSGTNARGGGFMAKRGGRQT